MNGVPHFNSTHFTFLEKEFNKIENGTEIIDEETITKQQSPDEIVISVSEKKVRNTKSLDSEVHKNPQIYRNGSLEWKISANITEFDEVVLEVDITVSDAVMSIKTEDDTEDHTFLLTREENIQTVQKRDTSYNPIGHGNPINKENILGDNLDNDSNTDITYQLKREREGNETEEKSVSTNSRNSTYPTRNTARKSTSLDNEDRFTKDGTLELEDSSRPTSNKKMGHSTQVFLSDVAQSVVSRSDKGPQDNLIVYIWGSWKLIVGQYIL